MSTAFPSGISIRSYRLDLNENKARTESIFTRQRQVVSLSGGTADRWEGLLTTRLLKEADAETFMSFLMDVGLYGEFTFEVPNYAGAASGESLGAVQGAGQSGTSLLVDGVSNSTLILAKGEYFQVRNELKRATANCTSNGSGEVTLNFKPALRTSPADNDPVDFASPVLLAQLTHIPSIEMDYRRLSQFTISFQEVMGE